MSPKGENVLEEVVILKGWIREGVKNTLEKRPEECATGGNQGESNPEAVARGCALKWSAL